MKSAQHCVVKTFSEWRCLSTTVPWRGKGETPLTCLPFTGLEVASFCASERLTHTHTHTHTLTHTLTHTHNARQSTVQSEFLPHRG